MPRDQFCKYNISHSEIFTKFDGQKRSFNKQNNDISHVQNTHLMSNIAEIDFSDIPMGIIYQLLGDIGAIWHTCGEKTSPRKIYHCEKLLGLYIQENLLKAMFRRMTIRVKCAFCHDHANVLNRKLLFPSQLLLQNTYYCWQMVHNLHTVRLGI